MCCFRRSEGLRSSDWFRRSDGFRMSDFLGFVRCDKLTYLEMMDLVDKPGLFVFKTQLGF
jgi:hypothetical protein